jgi:hypothetical protein
VLNSPRGPFVLSVPFLGLRVAHWSLLEGVAVLLMPAGAQTGQPQNPVWRLCDPCVVLWPNACDLGATANNTALLQHRVNGKLFNNLDKG